MQKLDEEGQIIIEQANKILEEVRNESFWAIDQVNNALLEVERDLEGAINALERFRESSTAALQEYAIYYLVIFI